MANENARLEMSFGSTPLGIQRMTDLGDHRTFGLDGVDTLAYCLPSKLRQNCVLSGVNMGSPAASGGDDMVDVAAITVSTQGTKTPVAASQDIEITRPATAVAKICCVTVDEDGVIAVVAGTDGTTTAFSNTRGAAGGPPLIPVDSIELFEVRVASNTSAPITAAQIIHTTEFPIVFTIDETGRGDHSKDTLQRRAHVRFGKALPLIHVGPTPRRVYIDAAEPEMVEISESADFKGAEVTVSSNVTPYYGTESSSFSKGFDANAGFKCKLKDGISDQLLAMRGEVCTFKFFADQDQPECLVTQGMVGVARTFSVGADTVGDVKIAASRASVEYFID